MKTNKIHFIMPKHSLTYKEIERAGYSIAQNYRGNTMPFRLLRELHFRFGLPGKSIWYNQKNRKLSGTIILYESLVIPDYVKWLYSNNPDSRIILFYENLSNKYNSPNNISRNWCEMWTADKNEAKEFKINWYSGGGYFKHWKVIKKVPDIDLFYIGKDKNRLETLKMIEDECNKRGVKTYFYITQDRNYKKTDSYHKPFLPYKEVLEYLGRTKAILHLSNGCQSGVTMRIEESLIHEIKLVTDDLDIVNYDFYNPNNFFVIGLDDWDKLPNFLTTEYVHQDSSFFNSAYFDDFVQTLLGAKQR